MPTQEDTLDVRRAKFGVLTVHGPYEHGCQFYGRVIKVDARFQAIAVDNRVEGGERPLGTFRRQSNAVDALAAWAPDNLTAAALAEEFEASTAGGMPLRFQRRVSSGVVAAVLMDERWVSMSWKADGYCSFYGDDPLLSEALRLVSRHPEVDLEPEPATENPRL